MTGKFPSSRLEADRGMELRLLPYPDCRPHGSQHEGCDMQALYTMLTELPLSRPSHPSTVYTLCVKLTFASDS